MRYWLLLGIFSLSFAEEVFLEKVEVRAKREVLTEEEVRESFAKDPGEALTEMEGVWKVRKGGIANDVVIRGFQRGNINVLFDGARIYQACPNRMDPPAFHIDFAEVKDIEVIKGPFDVRNYGSLGGTVNIRTVEPKKGFHGKFNLTVGSFSYFNPSLNLSYRADNFFGLVGYSYRYSKVYKTGEGKRFTEYPSGMNAYRSEYIDSTAFNINTFWAKGGISLDKDKGLIVSYTGQRARDVLYPYLMMDSPKDDADRLNVKLRLGNLNVTAYYSYVDHEMNNLKRVNPTYMETMATSETYGTKVEMVLGDLLAGIEAFMWNWKSETRMGTMPVQYTIPDVDTINVGLFGEYNFKMSKKFRIVSGLRLDSTYMRADGSKANTDLYYIYHGTRDTTKNDVYPSGNVQAFYKLSKGIELFAGLGYGVRAPDAQERYFALNRMGSTERMMGDWVGNPDLKPSKNTELDLGLSIEKKNLTFRATLFFSYVIDYITIHNKEPENPRSTMMDSNQKAKSYANVDARFFGGEAKFIYAITDTLFLEGDVSYVKAKKDTDPAKNIYDEDVAEIPPLKTRLALRYDRDNLFGEVETVASATQNNVDSDLGEEKTSGWAVVNLKGGYRFRGFRFVAGVNNLLDKYYYEHLSYLRDPFSTGTKVPEPGRSYYLSVAYRF